MATIRPARVPGPTSPLRAMPPPDSVFRAKSRQQAGHRPDDAEDSLTPELRQRMENLEAEYEELVQENDRMLASQGTRSTSGGRPESPIRMSGRRSVTPKLRSTPSKGRETSPQRSVDVEFAQNIGYGLINEARVLRNSVVEKDDELKLTQEDKMKLEAELERLRRKVRDLDESEQKYKDENWALETQLRGHKAFVKDAQTREQKLLQGNALQERSKTGIQRELDDLKMLVASMNEENALKKKRQEAELVNLRRDYEDIDGDRVLLEKKITELTSQNQELANAFATRLRHEEMLLSQMHTEGIEEEPIEADTFDELAPPSPSKGVTRIGGLETETSRGMMQHQQRTMLHYKNLANREKTEKLELKRRLQEAQDELDIRAREQGQKGKSLKKRGTSEREAKRMIRSSTLGSNRPMREEIMADPDWEEHQTLEGDPIKSRTLASANTRAKRSGPVARPISMSDDTEAFETANEAAGTATESDAFETGAEGVEDDEGELTETEQNMKGSLPSKHQRVVSRPFSVHRPSFHSTASGSDGEGEEERPSTPQEQQGFTKWKNSRNGAFRRSRFTSNETEGTPGSFRDSPASFMSGSTPGSARPQITKNLFDELEGMDGSEIGTPDGTPSRRIMSSRTTTDDSLDIPVRTTQLKHESRDSDVLPRSHMMQDAGTMTAEEENPEARNPEGSELHSTRPLTALVTPSGQSTAAQRDRAALTTSPVQPAEQVFAPSNLSAEQANIPLAGHGVPSLRRDDTTSPVSPAILIQQQSQPSNLPSGQGTVPDRDDSLSPQIAKERSFLSPQSPQDLEPASSSRYSPSVEQALQPPRPVRDESWYDESSRPSTFSYPLADPPSSSTFRDINPPAGGSLIPDSLNVGRSTYPEQRQAPSRPVVPSSDHEVQTTLTGQRIDELLASERAALIAPAAVSHSRNTTNDTLVEPGHSRNTTADTVIVTTPTMGRAPHLTESGLSPTRPSRSSMETTPRSSSEAAPLVSSNMINVTDDAPPVPAIPTNHQRMLAASQKPLRSINTPSESREASMGPPAMSATAMRATRVNRPKTPVEESQQSPSFEPGNASIYIPRNRQQQQPSVRSVARSDARGGAASRRSSVSSFASEIDERYNIASDGLGMGGMYQGDSHTDPRMIQAITQTMIGEYLWKYIRKTGRGEMSNKRHRRFFWVHPYTRTLYWSDRDPTTAGKAQLSAKSVAIEGVRVVPDDNPMPPGLHRKSILIHTPGRSVQFTAGTSQRHETWYNALSFLLLRPQPAAMTMNGRGPLFGDGGEAGRAVNEELAEFNPAYRGVGTSSGRYSQSRTSLAGGTTASRATSIRSGIGGSGTVIRRPTDGVGVVGPPPALSSASRYASGEGNASLRQSVGNMFRPSTSMRSKRSRSVKSEAEGRRMVSERVSGGAAVGSGAAASAAPDASVGGSKPPSVHETSRQGRRVAGNDSAEDVREVLERQERGADGLENVRACCDGQHDVGTAHINRDHRRRQTSRARSRASVGSQQRDSVDAYGVAV